MVIYDALYAWCGDTPLKKAGRFLGSRLVVGYCRRALTAKSSPQGGRCARLPMAAWRFCAAGPPAGTRLRNTGCRHPEHGDLFGRHSPRWQSAWGPSFHHRHLLLGAALLMLGTAFIRQPVGVPGCCFWSFFWYS